MEKRKYKVVISQSGKLDVKEKKKYILQQFKYREYAENFSKKIKKAVLALDTLPTGYNTTGFRYRGYDIYMKDDAKELSEQRIIVTGSIQTDWVPPVFMSAENRWTAEEKY